MTRRPAPRIITIDGVTMVALDPEEYDRLNQTRRQVGGYVKRLNIVTQQFHDCDSIFQAIAEVLAPHENDHPLEAADPTCALCAIRRHLEERPIDPATVRRRRG